MSWNVGASIRTLINNAGNYSKHQCAKYVRMALEAGGINTNNRPESAYKYKNFLPTIGFNLIGKIYGKESQDRWSSTNARQGDIAVMDHGVHGHICMWSGSQWISDFKQKNMWVYGGNGECSIFRYNGKIDNSLSLSDIEGLAGGLMYNYDVPRNKQKDNIIMNEITNIELNLIKEVLESEGVFFGYNKYKNINLISDLLVKDKYLNNYYYNRERTDSILKTQYPISEETVNIIYENIMGNCDESSSISEGIVANSIQWDLLPGYKGNGLNITSLNESEIGLSIEMLKQISIWEAGKEFGSKLSYDDLHGIDLGDANGHRTFGYGSLYHPSGKYMDQIKSEFTKEELESIFLNEVKNKVDFVKKWMEKNSLNLKQCQLDAIVSACYNFGNGFLTLKGKPYSEVVSLIKENPNNPMIKVKWSHISDVQGSRYPGLVERRKMEAEWYSFS